MPAIRSVGVPIAIGLALVLGCEVEDQGLVTFVPMPPAASPGTGAPPSIDPPAPSSPTEVDADAPDVGPAPAIDPPVPAPQDASADTVGRPDSAAPTATNCMALRPGPFTVRVRNANIASDELTFDPQGRLLFIRANDIVRWAEGLMPEVVLRDVLGAQGGALRFLTDGTLMVADFTGDDVTRYDLTNRSRLGSAETESPMKVAVGPRGRLYVSSNDGFIYMVNPMTGQRNVVASPDDAVGGLAFSADYQTLYAGLLDLEAIAAFQVRPQGQLGPPNIVASQIPFPMGLAVDECGNLYSSGGPDGNVRRISRSGRTEIVVRVNRPQLWGLGFGSGKHGWSQTALYLTSDADDDAGLFEVEIGVRGIPLAPEATPP
jgi:hypothetical protein